MSLLLLLIKLLANDRELAKIASKDEYDSDKVANAAEDDSKVSAANRDCSIDDWRRL